MIQFPLMLMQQLAAAAPTIAQGIGAGAAALGPAAAPVNPLLQFLGSITGGAAMGQGYRQLTEPVPEGVKPWQQRTAGALNVGRGVGQMSELLPRRQPMQPTAPIQQPQAMGRQMNPTAGETVDETLRRLYPHVFA